VITVGATNTHGTGAQTSQTMTSYSSKGPTAFDHIVKPDLVAPDCVTVPFSNGKSLANNQFCGTSASVPAIAAAAALLESAGFNRAQVLKALRTTAVSFSGATWDPGYGFGLVNAAAALRSGGH